MPPLRVPETSAVRAVPVVVRLTEVPFTVPVKATVAVLVVAFGAVPDRCTVRMLPRTLLPVVGCHCTNSTVDPLTPR